MTDPSGASRGAVQPYPSVRDQHDATHRASRPAAANLNQFIEQEALPGTGLDAASLARLSALVHDLAPKNRALLAERDRLQAELDAWHRAHPGPIADPAAYRKFLEDIGYLLPQPAQVRATTENVDTEISQQAGPQLVVPVSNPRYALNAANARWGSLYDALYGTDAIPATPGDDGKGYNPSAPRVIARARAFRFALAQGSHADATGYTIDNGQLRVTLASGATTLKSPSQLIGYQGPADAPSAVLLKNNGLHFEIQVDRGHAIGATDAAGVKDVLLEAALTTIMDCEDSVAAVDAEDKVHIYRNWLGLMKGDLTEQVSKGGKTFTRKLNADRQYTRPDGSALTLHGRSLMFVRNVGHLMTNPAVLDREGREIPEGILDAVVTSRLRCRIARTSSTPAPARSTSSSPRCTARRSRLRQRDLRPRRRPAGPAAPHAQDGHHGRGTPHQHQPQGLHRAAARPSSIPASWTAPATRCTPTWKPARCCARAT